VLKRLCQKEKNEGQKKGPLEDKGCYKMPTDPGGEYYELTEERQNKQGTGRAGKKSAAKGGGYIVQE